MPAHEPRTVIDQLPAALRDDLVGLPDGRLLERYLRQHDEAAFEVLLRRHRAMVFGVCRRYLRQAVDAEDAFQATFLVLLRQGAGLVHKGNLGGWLHGVARNTSRKFRELAERRAVRDRSFPRPTPSNPEDPVEAAETLGLLDDELARLPDALREAIILCELQGRPVREASALLGVPVGTLSGRLTTARRRLAARLSARGIDAPTALAMAAAPGVVPAVHRCGAVAETITREVMAMMLWTYRVKIALLTLTALLAVGTLVAGVTFALVGRPEPVVVAHEEPGMPAVEEKSEFPEAQLDVKTDAVHAAGVPIVLDVKLTNLGQKPLSYWCGGPGMYPGFNSTLVSITDARGRTTSSLLSNGQHVEGSGIHRAVASCTSVQVPGVLPALPPGRYTLRIGKGEPAKIEVKADDAVGRTWDESLLKRVRSGEPFAQHVAREAARPGVLDSLLRDLAEGKPDDALQACFTFWLMRDLPANASAAVARALPLRQEQCKDEDVRRTDLLSYLAILAGRIKSEELIAPLTQGAKMADLGERTATRFVDALGEFPQPTAKAALHKFLADTTGRIQFSAAWALARQSDSRALPLLLTTAADRDHPRRVDAFFLLRFFKKDLAVEGVLRKALEDPNQAVVDAARRSLQ